ncbi:MAG TPA: nickel insertion protein, partial [Nitrososphaera sp.]|nr:nickel insertion protein [Nitrososphaera sp.]
AQASKDTVFVVETNIDDASGELIGNIIDRLTEVSKDVTVIPGTTKKSRPAYLIRIISDQAQLNDVLEILFSESGTLGIRVQEVERFVLPRSVLTVPVNIKGTTFNVRVKVAKNSGGRIITHVKPEFEDVRMIASRCQISVKRAMELVSAEVMQKVGTTYEIKF